METTEQITNLILLINKLYIQFNNRFYVDSSFHSFRVDKTSCSKALETDFLMDVPLYIQSLETYKAKTISQACRSYLPFLRMRVKRYETVKRKLEAKSCDEKIFGGYPIEKVINDLMGFRVILPEVNSQQDNINDILEQNKEEKIISRFYTRFDGDYHGVHCYFKQNNRTLPWELQIWDIDDKSDNIRSHLEHEMKRSHILKEGGYES
ncbi:nucleotidyltransferase family protein [Limosilactobacillus vaginalis]|uniref:hypothetical protein n=1 Tax=Limosilactobacillus vaginalis TaxID=1633 RepID=UPI003F1E65C0